MTIEQYLDKINTSLREGFGTELTYKISNFSAETIHQIATNLSLGFTKEKETPSEGEVCFANSPQVRPEFRLTFASIDISDYIYAVLNSSAYKKNYKENLKIDFPDIPYPEDTSTFWQLVMLGSELRQIHLLECSVLEKYNTQFPVDGNNMVTKISFIPYLIIMK